MKKITLAVSALALVACTQNTDPHTETAVHDPMPHAQHSDTPNPADITLGNGEDNRIELAGLKRNGPTLTISEVLAKSDSFMVLHPFMDGTPVQTDYVGSTFIPAGAQTDISIRLDAAPDEGTPFIIMLHRDVNQDGDFQFGDGVTVPDAPVFEGSTLIALPMQAPASSPVTPELIRSSAKEHMDKAAAFIERTAYRDDQDRARLRAVVHRWLAEVEKTDKSPEAARTLFTEDFTLNFPSGPISSTEALTDWLRGPASAFAATRHVLSNIDHERREDGGFILRMVMNWDGLTQTGERLSAKTQHQWHLVDSEAALPLIEQVDVEILEPFVPASWDQ